MPGTPGVGELTGPGREIKNPSASGASGLERGAAGEQVHSLWLRESLSCPVSLQTLPVCPWPGVAAFLGPCDRLGPPRITFLGPCDPPGPPRTVDPCDGPGPPRAAFLGPCDGPGPPCGPDSGTETSKVSSWDAMQALVHEVPSAAPHGSARRPAPSCSLFTDQEARARMGATCSHPTVRTRS